MGHGAPKTGISARTSMIGATHMVSAVSGLRFRGLFFDQSLLLNPLPLFRFGMASPRMRSCQITGDQITGELREHGLSRLVLRDHAAPPA